MVFFKNNLFLKKALRAGRSGQGAELRIFSS